MMSNAAATDVAESAPVAAAEAVAQAMAAPAPAPAPAQMARTEPAAAPVVTAPPPPVAPYHLPTDSLSELAASAGLQWVQSDADKISAVQAAMAAEPAPVRVPREPRRHVLVDDGPLVLVETRKDLSQLKLPFEQQSAAST
jgi:ribonuclease E